MSDTWLRRMAWATATVAVAILVTSVFTLVLVTDNSSSIRWGNLLSSLVALGAPILGVFIAARQPRNRIGWLFIAYGLAIGFRSLGHGIYLLHSSQPTGYSALEYFLLWSTEPANMAVILCLILLLLWFPDGALPSHRWRLLYVWLIPAFAVLFLSNFASGPNWNGGAAAGGIVIDNPYGWLTINSTNPVNALGFFAFPSLLVITTLAVVSLIFRYRAAGQLVRMQIGWFVLGGFFSFILFILPIFGTLPPGSSEGIINNLLELIGQAFIIPLYLAVGVAILRYRLYDIQVIIRRTLLYTLLTALLALFFFGSVVLLQRLFEAVTGQQSQLAIVLSTLAIAALFNPLRTRIQGWIDRRFYRKKYDAQQVLAQFAITARDETDMNVLTMELARVVQEAIEPDGVCVVAQVSHAEEAFQRLMGP